MPNLRSPVFRPRQQVKFQSGLFWFMSHVLLVPILALCVVCFREADKTDNKDSMDWLIAGIIFLIFFIVGLVVLIAKHRMDIKKKTKSTEDSNVNSIVDK